MTEIVRVEGDVRESDPMNVSLRSSVATVLRNEYGRTVAIAPEDDVTEAMERMSMYGFITYDGDASNIGQVINENMEDLGKTTVHLRLVAHSVRDNDKIIVTYYM